MEKKAPFTIVFHDEHLLVVNKTARILIQPSPKKEKYTLTSVLSEALGVKVYPCHRLDRETTGLIIYAKEHTGQERIMDEFRRGRVKKRYWAFVRGRLSRRKGVLEGFILDREGRRFKEKEKKAKTFYRVTQEFRAFSVLEIEPVTGRTNQIRIQLKEIGHPLLGERQYAFGRDFPVNFRRLALHAFFISFRHPVGGQYVEVKIDMPEDMKTFLQKHR